MLLGEVFDRFAAESPASVMARAAFEHALPSEAVDALFAERPERQYTRELLFSQLVDLMGLVVCRVQPSLNAAFRKRADDLGVTRKAVYAKIARTEPGLGAALARHTLDTPLSSSAVGSGSQEVSSTQRGDSLLATEWLLPVGTTFNRQTRSGSPPAAGPGTGAGSASASRRWCAPSARR